MFHKYCDETHSLATPGLLPRDRSDSPSSVAAKSRHCLTCNKMSDLHRNIKGSRAILKIRLLIRDSVLWRGRNFWFAEALSRLPRYGNCLYSGTSHLGHLHSWTQTSIPSLYPLPRALLKGHLYSGERDPFSGSRSLVLTSIKGTS